MQAAGHFGPVLTLFLHYCYDFCPFSVFDSLVNVPVLSNIYTDSLKPISSAFPMVSWDLVSFSPHWITWKLRMILCFVFCLSWFILPFRTSVTSSTWTGRPAAKTESLFLFSKYLAQYLTQKNYLTCICHALSLWEEEN